MAKKITTVTTTRADQPEPKSRIVQRTTTTRVDPEPKPRVVEQTTTVEKQGIFGGKKTTVKRATTIEE